MSINESIFSFARDDYQRDNFDSFLKKVSFKYEVPTIHIAGTNGKTIVATLLNNVYKHANYKTGLFISSPNKYNLQTPIIFLVSLINASCFADTPAISFALLNNSSS